MFEGDFKLNYHMAPPLIAKKNAKGELIKQPFGPAMMTAFKLAGPPQGPARRRVRHLWQDRGAQDRARADRRVPRQHRGSAEVTEADNHATAVEIARIPEQIKGFGHVKERHLKAARQNWSALMAAYRAPQGARQAA
jgi:indolepyruvate ferredoxin oxidoreductase